MYVTLYYLSFLRSSFGSLYIKNHPGQILFLFLKIRLDLFYRVCVLMLTDRKLHPG